MYSPAQALDHMNAELKTSLNKNKNIASLRDGMDMSLCFIDLENKTMEYAGANNPIYVIRNQSGGPELLEFKADKQSITAWCETVLKPFTNKTIPLLSGDVVYLFTDGYADQFGGTVENNRPDGKKFLNKRFKETLLSIYSKPMREQKVMLEKVLSDWQGNLQQVDDVLVMGVRIS
jgi:serine phosphatase RsbU (regulator of sigma subunit)